MIGPDLYTFRELWRQYRRCRRNKRNTANALAFELDAEANLLALQDELRTQRYRPGGSICFVTDGPKPREVFAADFRDRVVHHLLVSQLERLFEPGFIHDSYACRAGKGTLAASDRLQQFLRQATANGQRAAWALHLDVASFFPSIHKATLYDIIAQRCRDPELLWLTRVLLFHDPTTNYRFRTLVRRRGGCAGGSRRPGPPRTPGYPVPAAKSLFGTDNQRGLPIGNLTSQFWANVYLDVLDQYVKRTLKCRWYVRYVDDLVLLAHDPADLRRWAAAIEEFLATRLRLRLRTERREPAPVQRGVEFVGWRTWWDRRLPRRGSVQRLRRRGGEVPGLTRSLASYAGHLRHGAAWQAWQRVWAEHPWLRALCRCDGWRVVPLWGPRPRPADASYAARYRALLRRVGDDRLLFQRVGRYVEFHGPQRAKRVLGLPALGRPRAGYALTAGFPVWCAARFAERAVRSGVGVVMVRAWEPGLDRPLVTALWPAPLALGEIQAFAEEGSPCVPCSGSPGSA